MLEGERTREECRNRKKDVGETKFCPRLGDASCCAKRKDQPWLEGAGLMF